MEKKPVFGTFEWASHNANCCFGCIHNCKYCYAKAKAIKNGKKNSENWNVEIISKKAVDREYTKKEGTIMFPTNHDITPNNVDACLTVLRKILAVGNNVLIVSKPHLTCIEKLCLNLFEYKDNILFRFTIGSADDEVLKYWEPNAPGFMERAFSLAFAYGVGFKTSISCEPMLDDDIGRVVELTKPYVTDAIWLGKMNFAEDRLRTNGQVEAIEKAKELLTRQDDNYIKFLYDAYKDEPKIKWKDSIKEILGLERLTEPGLDK